MRTITLGTGLRVLWLAGVVGFASGCRHKAKVAPLPIPPPQQLSVDTTAKVAPPAPVVQKVPLQPTPLPAVTVPAKKKKRTRKPRKPASPATNIAVPGPGTAGSPQIASAAPVAEVSPIGALTPGGSETPQLRKQATELIGAVDKRLAGLTSNTKKNQRDAIARVMNFERQAQTALAAGDSEGAVTLATKAKLLLDDLIKQEPR